ncbi:MAG TPA: M48 family metallopeptidase [Elusimicrobiota bacterium]|jgi:predicted Zn-dependent protease|nr:M48 family metallopeptidase [Elusimicrobiota bacterium]
MTMRRARVCLAALPLALAACQTVPYTGRHHLLLVSQGEEKSLGLQAYQDTLKKAKLSTDHENVELIRRIGRRLAAVADRPDFQWEFNLIDDPKTVNAFCLPGGKVAVYSGILPVAKGEDGLAVVMGHEIAHALARHGSERMSQGMIAQFGGQALSVLLSGQSAAAQSIYGQAYGLGVNVGVLLPFSRGQESEADHIGLILMAKAGYDPEHALEFWKRMETASGSSGPSVVNFLRTHPSDVKRQEQIRDWLPEIREKYYHP